MKFLEEAFDRNIIATISVFVAYPKKHFTLRQIGQLSGVKNVTTLRIINRLVERNYLRKVTIGKIKYYQLPRGKKGNNMQQLIDTGIKQTPSGQQWIVEKV